MKNQTRNLSNLIFTVVGGSLCVAISCEAGSSPQEQRLGQTHHRMWLNRQAALNAAERAINENASGPITPALLGHFATIDAWGGLQFDKWEDVVEAVGPQVKQWEQWFKQTETRRAQLNTLYQSGGAGMSRVFQFRDEPKPLPMCADASPVPVQVETLLSSSGIVLRRGMGRYSLDARTGFKILSTPNAYDPQITHSASCHGGNRFCNGTIEDSCKENTYCGQTLYASGRVTSSCGPHESNPTVYDRRSRPISFRWRLFRDMDDDF